MSTVRIIWSFRSGTGHESRDRSGLGHVLGHVALVVGRDLRSVQQLPPVQLSDAHLRTVRVPLPVPRQGRADAARNVQQTRSVDRPCDGRRRAPLICVLFSDRFGMHLKVWAWWLGHHWRWASSAPKERKTSSTSTARPSRFVLAVRPRSVAFWHYHLCIDRPSRQLCCASHAPVTRQKKFSVSWQEDEAAAAKEVRLSDCSFVDRNGCKTRCKACRICRGSDVSRALPFAIVSFTWVLLPVSLTPTAELSVALPAQNVTRRGPASDGQTARGGRPGRTARLLPVPVGYRLVLEERTRPLRPYRRPIRPTSLRTHPGTPGSSTVFPTVPTPE